MEKVLNQEEIDALLRRTHSGSGGGEKSQGSAVTLWDVQRTGQIRREEVQSISSLHEAFARSLTHAVGAYLRIGFTAALVSAEHITYGEVLTRIPEISYLATCKLSPLDETALVQLDLAVAFPLIDVLLGGEGSSNPAGRQITEIEEQVLETIMRIICRELQNAWQVLNLEFEFEQRQQPEQIQRHMSSEDKTLSLNFDLTVAENHGTLNLIFPTSVSNALLRKLATSQVRVKRKARPDAEQRLRNHLLSSPFRLDLETQIGGLALRELMSLSPGQLLLLKCPARQPAALRVGGYELFVATVARRGHRRAAQVLQRCAEIERKST